MTKATAPYFYAHHRAGPRGWEIGETETRHRICAEMEEPTAKALCALLNAAYPLADEYSIPATQIAAILRLIKDNGGLPTDD